MMSECFHKINVSHSKLNELYLMVYASNECMIFMTGFNIISCFTVLFIMDTLIKEQS